MRKYAWLFCFLVSCRDTSTVTVKIPPCHKIVKWEYRFAPDTELSFDHKPTEYCRLSGRRWICFQEQPCNLEEKQRE